MLYQSCNWASFYKFCFTPKEHIYKESMCFSKKVWVPVNQWVKVISLILAPFLYQYNIHEATTTFPKLYSLYLLVLFPTFLEPTVQVDVTFQSKGLEFQFHMHQKWGHLEHKTFWDVSILDSVTYCNMNTLSIMNYDMMWVPRSVQCTVIVDTHGSGCGSGTQIMTTFGQNLWVQQQW